MLRFHTKIGDRGMAGCLLQADGQMLTNLLGPAGGTE